MSVPTPTNGTVAESQRALSKVRADQTDRERRRRELARETGYTMFMPGFF